MELIADFREAESPLQADVPTCLAALEDLRQRLQLVFRKRSGKWRDKERHARNKDDHEPKPGGELPKAGKRDQHGNRIRHKFYKKP